MRVPWTARRSILKEISPEYSLEGLMLKLKLQYFVYLMRRTDSLEKTLMLAKIEGGRRRGQQRMRCLAGITDSMDMSWRKFWELEMDREACHAAVHVHGVTKSRTRLSNSYSLDKASFSLLPAVRYQKINLVSSPSHSAGKRPDLCILEINILFYKLICI